MGALSGRRSLRRRMCPSAGRSLTVRHMAPAPNLAVTYLALNREVPLGSVFVNVPQVKLQFGTDNVKVVFATPVKRRGKSMSRRTGQDGHFEQSGKWWVL